MDLRINERLDFDRLRDEDLHSLIEHAQKELQRHAALP
jgi:hypothetical protein